MAETLTFAARPAFPEIAALPAGAAGVSVRELTPALATVQSRRGRAADLRAEVRARFGLELPDGPRRVSAGPVAFVGTGPDAWMAVDEAGAVDLSALHGPASVADQSSGYAVLRLAGPAVRQVLAKGVFLDLHPAAFPPGASAGTTLGHIGVILWRVEADTFDLVCFRSYADSLWRWLEEAAAEYGLSGG